MFRVVLFGLVLGVSVVDRADAADPPFWKNHCKCVWNEEGKGHSSVFACDQTTDKWQEQCVQECNDVHKVTKIECGICKVSWLSDMYCKEPAADSLSNFTALV
eukprot:CAMPEP_0171210758 /NCGR_PEP_ID=MMETSP0790-20130122/29273_1 /TAXON_ID=2925 /ORGANISM="Alexandrium catenella, Strain OF101" /LENGTH=102 /DNA_ID=CAMNT_0011676403 /DNA_START=100 /DNA_END=408 /DNA_ORIENTATION=+